MLNRRIIGNISREIATDSNGIIQPESGLNPNNYNQLRKALNIAEFARNDYKENFYKAFDEYLKYLLIALSSINEPEEKALPDFMKYLCITVFSLKDPLEDVLNTAKYSLDVAALKSKMLEINLIDLLKEIKDKDIISLLDALTEMLDKDISVSKQARNNNIKYSDIKSVDLNNIYLDGKLGEISVAKIPYLSAKTKNDLKYGLSLLGRKALNGTSKILKKIDKKKSV